MEVKESMKTYAVDTIESPSTEQLLGDVLFVSGSNFRHRLNSPARHLPRGLARHTRRMDVVGYLNFYGGPPCPAWQRLARGAKNIISDRVQITEAGAGREILIRRLHMPQPLEVLAEDLWIYLNLRPVLAQSYDVGVVGHADNALLAAILKRTGRIKHLIYSDWDYFPSYVDRRWSGLTARREGIYVRLADGIISVSRPLAKLRQRQGARRVAVVPNGVDFELFQTALSTRKSHPPTLIYSGSVDARWGIDLAIRALPILRDRIPNIRFLIAGDGPAMQEMRELAASLGVGELVHFAGMLPYEQLPVLMAEADIGIATSRQDAFRQYASPLKLVEYMAAGLPVICSGGGEAELLAEESGAGVHVPFTPEALAEAALSLLQNPEKAKKCQAAGIEFASSRSWDRLGTQMSERIAEMIGQASFVPETAG